ncbi:ribbon-helix-helix domain-containing protein [Demequina salsinemoris]|uniref:ribbon-helix-helix domain-containing protein n=1 Tax=Demequina salsinemoris TaxID=577470 RepID=UPI0009FEB7FE|nr:ribbon-helix-helix domain-containing protein [Demequina salsinemoris]
MKTAISLPDADLERLDRVAARHGMNRSEFFREAGRRYADELEGASDLTALADAALARAGQPSGDGLFVAESERLLAGGLERLDNGAASDGREGGAVSDGREGGAAGDGREGSAVSGGRGEHEGTVW